MKNIVLKTALMTLALVFALIIMVFGVLTLWFPKTLINISSDMGMRSVAVWYSERAYEKSNSESDLKDLLFRANQNKDYDRTVKYSSEFFSTDTYKSLNIQDKNYFAGHYAVALYNVGTESSVIFNFIDGYNQGEYAVNNPYEYLVYSFDKNESKYDSAFLTALKTCLEDKKSGLADDNLARINESISVLEKLLNG